MSICEQRAPPPFYTLSSSLRGLLYPAAHTATDKDYITFINPAELRSEDHTYCQRLRRLCAHRGTHMARAPCLRSPAGKQRQARTQHLMVHCCKYNVCLQDLQLRSQYIWLNSSASAQLPATLDWVGLSNLRKYSRQSLPRSKQDTLCNSPGNVPKKR